MSLTNPHLMTGVIIILYAINSVWYLYHGDFGRMSYWVCAAGITISTTFLIGRG